MKIKKINLLAIILCSLTLLTASCSVKHDLAYFEDISESQQGILKAAKQSISIVPKDELTITVHSKVPAAVAHFNLPATDLAFSSQKTVSTENMKLATYVVDSNGDIDFPVFGKIHVAGMTTEQVKDYLTKRISETVKDPVVAVHLVNFKVNILGEVKEPKVLYPGSERYTILEALAECGDLTEYGRRENVIVMREREDGNYEYGKIDLHDSHLTESPYFYLQQNDVVYVSPNSIRQANSKYNQNNGFKLTVISTIISGVSVITSLVIALTVK